MPKGALIDRIVTPVRRFFGGASERQPPCEAEPEQRDLDSPATTLEDAIARLLAHDGPPQTLELKICDSLLDPTGVTMAVVTDAALSRDFFPNGIRQEDGYRVYLYRALD